MAAIDKIYIKDYNLYKEFLEWARNKIYICPNGIKIKVLDFTYSNFKEEDVKGKEFPVMNTPCSLDYFLIKDCPFKFIKDRFKEVYDEEYINKILSGISDYDLFKYPTEKSKIKIVKKGYLFEHKNYLYKYKRRSKIIYPKFDIVIKYKHQLLDYNEDINRFLLPNELGLRTSNSIYKCRSIKSLIRIIKKLNLPKDCEIIATGRYVGEEIILKTY